MSTTAIHEAILENEVLDSASAAVLKTLLYYDLFNYPLSAEEILSHCGLQQCEITTVQLALDDLCESEIVFRYNHFYSISDEYGLIERRIRGNEEAAKALPIAKRRSKLISKFPFVRAVCISGSFSKNYFDETTDLDFFIITEPNRLWVCRTLLILYKKIFLFNSKKFFCVNYFIDTDQLKIPDENIFTATEISTLLPMYNSELYRKFFGENEWVKNYFPNSRPKKKSAVIKVSDAGVKQVVEKLLSGRIGEWLDKFFYRRTVSLWSKKFIGQSHEEFELNMRSRRNVSKHHPQGFQFQVLKRYEERIRSFETQHQLTLE